MPETSGTAKGGAPLVGPSSVFVLGSFVMACTASVDRLPAAGETLAAGAFRMEPGGKGFNQALGAARLGAAADGLLAVGDDLFAGRAAQALADQGLPPAMLVRIEGATTGAGVGIIGADGENVIAVHPGANALLAAGHVRAAAGRLQQARVVTAQFEIGDGPVAEGFALARASGAVTVLNPSPYRPIPPAILANTDILILNETEAAALARQHGVALHALVPGVIVTQGARGAVHSHAGGSFHQPAFPVQTRDAIGAGDAFLAGFATALSAGAPIPQALREAAACGALVASRPGVIDALPTRREMAEFLAGRAEGSLGILSAKTPSRHLPVA